MTKGIPFHFRKRFLFAPKLGMSLFALFFIFLFIFLGIWQLHRYHFKKNLILLSEQRLQSQPLPFLTLSKNSKELQFQPVLVEGRYLNQFSIFIQDRFYKDKIGYEILTPFQIAGDKKLLLIDRGFLQRAEDKLLPTVDAVTGERKIKGYIKLLNEHQFTLGKNILNTTQFPLVAQKIDVNELAQLTHFEFYPFILRLNASEPNGFIRDWTIISMQPERHLGYAVQWFAMALVLFIAFICFSCEKVEDHL